MYTRSRRSQWSLQLSLWADAVGGSARNLQRRREMGWRYRQGAGQSTAALYAADQAERRRTMNRRKTQAITAAIVLGVTVPAWAVVNAVSTPSAHNGLAPVSDGTAFGAANASGDQLTQMLSSVAQNAPALTDDGPSDSAWARTMSAAHQFDLPSANDPSTVSQPAAPQRAVALDENADLPDADSPDASAPAPQDVITAPDETATVPDTIAAPGQHATKSERHERFNTHRHGSAPAQEGVTPAAPVPAAPSSEKTDPSDPASPGSGWSTTPQSPAKSTPSTGAAVSTPDKPTPSKPVAATPGKPAPADPAAPAPSGPLAADPAAPDAAGTKAGPPDATGRIADRASSGEAGGGATRGEGRAADGKGAHGKVAKADPSAP